MLTWMARTALELIGQAGLGYSFDPLVADKPDDFAVAVKAFSYVCVRVSSLRISCHSCCVDQAGGAEHYVTAAPDPVRVRLGHAGVPPVGTRLRPVQARAGAQVDRGHHARAFG